mmetsp:Transcript_13401/g.31467  ORF Transcript_13401/g.31467 Transcript_13401/m.31467 type:complete len:201 (-) Transcript_13401:133-735(-)
MWHKDRPWSPSRWLWHGSGQGLLDREELVGLWMGRIWLRTHCQGLKRVRHLISGYLPSDGLQQVFSKWLPHHWRDAACLVGRLRLPRGRFCAGAAAIPQQLLRCQECSEQTGGHSISSSSGRGHKTHAAAAGIPYSATSAHAAAAGLAWCHCSSSCCCRLGCEEGQLEGKQAGAVSKHYRLGRCSQGASSEAAAGWQPSG